MNREDNRWHACWRHLLSMCNSALVFDPPGWRTIAWIWHHGKSSGILIGDVDRQTGILVAAIHRKMPLRGVCWIQICGMIPSPCGKVFERFVKPSGRKKLLVPNNPNMRRYGSNPYVNYDSAARHIRVSWRSATDIGPMVARYRCQTGWVTKGNNPDALRDQHRVKLGDVGWTWERGRTLAWTPVVFPRARMLGNVVA